MHNFRIIPFPATWPAPLKAQLFVSIEPNVSIENLEKKNFKGFSPACRNSLKFRKA
tara:strand:- start:2689 stop:2856 length:168 start_codon:yes stop_codon:yes gene_type:complete